MLMLTAIKAWWAKSRWAVWSVIGVCVVIMLAVLRSIVLKKPNPSGESILPPVPKILQDKVDRAHEDNLKARVEAKVTADEHKKQLDTVMKIDDAAERRKRLAEMLNKT